MTGLNLKRFLIIGTTSIVCTLVSLSWVSRFHHIQNTMGQIYSYEKDLTSPGQMPNRSDVQQLFGANETLRPIQPGKALALTTKTSHTPQNQNVTSRLKIDQGKKVTPKGSVMGITQSKSSKSKLKSQELTQKSSRQLSKSLSSRRRFRRPLYVRTPAYRSYNSTLVYNLTKDFKLNLPHLCGSRNVSDVSDVSGPDLLIMVFSAVRNDLARLAIRNTWGGYAVKQGAKLAFLLGGTTKEKTQFKVRQEFDAYKDLIQGLYVDHYYNLTLKTVSMMNWVSTYCKDKVKFVLKVDDDMFVNMPRLLTILHDWVTYERTVIGKLAVRWKPHREKSSKWYIPWSDFPQKVFPNFTTGPAYVFSADVSEDLYKESLKTTFLPLEDVFMTGIVAEKVGVKRLHHPGFLNTHIPVIKPCSSMFLTIHMYTPAKLAMLWDTLMHPKNCFDPER